MALEPPARTCCSAAPRSAPSEQQLSSRPSAASLANAPAPPPAGRPEAGQPSAEPKLFGSRKNSELDVLVIF